MLLYRDPVLLRRGPQVASFLPVKPLLLTLAAAFAARAAPAGSYWVLFENSGDSAASAAFVDLLPRSVLPLVAAAKLVRYPMYQETQQDYQLEQQQQQDCDLVRCRGAAILLLRLSQCCFL